MPTYTAYCNYFATGEGVTHMVLVTYADDVEDMRKKFTIEYGDWYALGVEITEGINACPFVLEQHMVGTLVKASINAYINYKCSFHVNGS